MMFGGQQAHSNQAGRVPGASARCCRPSGRRGRVRRPGAAPGCCRRTRRRSTEWRRETRLNRARSIASANRLSPVASSSRQATMIAGDGRAGLAVDEVGRQLVLVAERLALEPGADRAGQVELGRASSTSTAAARCRAAPARRSPGRRRRRRPAGRAPGPRARPRWSARAPGWRPGSTASRSAPSA